MAAAAVAGVIAGCASASSPRSVPPVSARPSAAETPKSVSYDLFTHCGIQYARVGNRYYQAIPPLSDGSGNPPPGWGNPYQPGTLIGLVFHMLTGGDQDEQGFFGHVIGGMGAISDAIAAAGRDHGMRDWREPAQHEGQVVRISLRRPGERRARPVAEARPVDGERLVARTEAIL